MEFKKTSPHFSFCPHFSFPTRITDQNAIYSVLVKESMLLAKLTYILSFATNTRDRINHMM